MRSPVTLMFALALLSGGLWLVLRVGTGSDAPPSALTFPRGDEEPELVVPPPVTAAAGEPGGGLRFVVDVDALARVLPPPPQHRFRVVRGGREVDLEVEVLAGAGARLTGGPMRAGRSLVRVHAGDRLLYRIVGVEEPEGSTFVSLGTGVGVSGRVVDRQSQPVAGAEVWYGEASAESGLLTVATDEDGRFSLDGMTGGPGTPVVVSAPGHASHLRVLETGGGELLFVMSPASRLRLQLVSSAEQVGLARAALLPMGAVTTEQLQYPFVMQSVRGWNRLDSAGTCVFEDVPRGVTVGAVVHHPLAPAHPPVPVELRRDMERVQVPLELATPMSGRVLDAEGGPVSGALVVSFPEGREPSEAAPSRWLLPPGTGVTGLTWCRTGEDGRYSIGRSQSAARADAVSVRAPGLLGLLARIEPGRWTRPLREDFVLAAPPAGEAVPELRFHAGDGVTAWLRVRPEPGFRPMPEDGPLVRPLARPALLRLRVATVRGNGLSEAFVLPLRLVAAPEDIELLADGTARWRQR